MHADFMLVAEFGDFAVFKGDVLDGAQDKGWVLVGVLAGGGNEYMAINTANLFSCCCCRRHFGKYPN